MNAFRYICGPLVIILAFFGLFSCGDGFNQGEDHGDMLGSSGGLTLDPHKHAGGWGRADCLFCHPIENLHLDDTTVVPGISMPEIRAITIQEGEASCPSCHGTNGVGVPVETTCITCHTGGIPD